MMANFFWDSLVPVASLQHSAQVKKQWPVPCERIGRCYPLLLSFFFWFLKMRGLQLPIALNICFSFFLYFFVPRMRGRCYPLLLNSVSLFVPLMRGCSYPMLLAFLIFFLVFFVRAMLPTVLFHFFQASHRGCFSQWGTYSLSFDVPIACRER